MNIKKDNFWLRQIGYTFIPFVMVGIEIGKKMNSKAKGILAGILSFVLLTSFISIIMNDNDSEQIIDNNTHVITQTIEPTEESIVKPTEKPTMEPVEKTVKPTIDIRLDINAAKNILEANYDGIATVKIKDNAILIIPLDKAGIMNDVLLAKNGNEKCIESWNKIIKVIKDTSKDIESDILISIINPINEDNVLLAIIDGVVIYNYLDE